MTQYDITLLTMQDYLSAEPGDTFAEDIILDDRLLTTPLQCLARSRDDNRDDEAIPVLLKTHSKY